MKGLLLHCGSQHVDRNELDVVPCPDGTDTHRPIQHGLLLTKIEAELDKLGYGILSQGQGVSKDGMDAFGIIQVARRLDAGNSTLFDSRPEYGTVVGWRNSNKKKFPVELAIGNGVFVCDNLCFNGATKVARRHTKFMFDELNERISGALERILVTESTMDARIAHYQNVGVTRADKNEFIVQCYERDIVPGRSLGQLIQEINEPRHSDFNHNNGWGLMNCATEILKTAPNLLTERTMALTQYCDNQWGFNPRTAQTVETTLAV